MPEAGSTIYWLIGGIVLAAAVIFIFSKAFPQFGDKIKEMMDGLLGAGTTASKNAADQVKNAAGPSK